MMKKYILIVLLVITGATFCAQVSRIPSLPASRSAFVRNPSQSLVPANRVTPLSKQTPPVQRSATLREQIMKPFNAAIIEIKKRMAIAKRMINEAAARKDEATRKQLSEEFQEVVCKECTSFNAVKAENGELKKQLANTQKEASLGKAPVQETKELEKQLITAKKEIQEKQDLIKEITKGKDEPIQLAQLKKRTKKEFGKKAYEKMIAGNDLKLSDLFADKQARFGTLLSTVKEEEELSERELQMNLKLEQLKLESEECNKKLAALEERPKEVEMSDEQAQKEKKQNKELAQLKTKNKELKEENKKLESLSAVEGARDALLAKEKELEEIRKQLSEAQQGTQSAMASEEAYINQISNLLSRFFGNEFSEAVMGRYDLSEHDFTKKIDRNTSFMQALSTGSPR